MRTYVASLLLVAMAAGASGSPVTVFIAPRTNSLAGSGKVSFDVYWVNESERAAAIPARGRYNFSYSSLGASLGFAAGAMQIADRPSPDRRIGPQTIIRDRVTINMQARDARLLEVTAEFRGHRSKFKSNTIVLANLLK